MLTSHGWQGQELQSRSGPLWPHELGAYAGACDGDATTLCVLRVRCNSRASVPVKGDGGGTSESATSRLAAACANEWELYPEVQRRGTGEGAWVCIRSLPLAPGWGAWGRLDEVRGLGSAEAEPAAGGRFGLDPEANTPPPPALSSLLWPEPLSGLATSVFPVITVVVVFCFKVEASFSFGNGLYSPKERTRFLFFPLWVITYCLVVVSERVMRNADAAFFW